MAELEAEFNATFIQLFNLFGWKVAHFRSVRVQRKDGSCYWQTPVQGDGKGFPDNLCVQPVKGWRLAAELKVGNRPRSAEQTRWLEWCEAVGIPAYTWQPKDWDEIKKVAEFGP